MAQASKKFYAGIDGGGTKTAALCGDAAGRLLGYGLAGPSNYQVVGLKAAMTAVQEALDAALQQAGIRREQLAGAVFALSGADLPVDMATLQEALSGHFAGIPFTLVNDSWAAFRAGTAASFGAVSLCGTGTNAAARNRQGQTAALRSLGYECGNWGGAADLAREALHSAFRSEEGTGPKTALQDAVLAQFSEIKNYTELAYALREDLYLKYQSTLRLPRLVFTLAAQGDAVAQDLLIRMGTAVGGDCAAVIRAVGLEDTPCDVVLAGGMFAASRQYNPLLVDSFTLALHRRAPLARPLLLERPPAAGAYLLALEEDGRPAGADIEAALDRSLPEVLVAAEAL
ncbi:MAG TPA: BadF/BadG/BcrA/BcrD ATPase family protein, partial [Bacillota bacterium]|nr:BadF/BadG/BcrA/BcrD ATPase family protein [Bacillota bacterium]